MLYNSTMFTNFTTVMVKTNKMEMVLILMIVTNLLSSVPSGTDSTTRKDFAFVGAKTTSGVECNCYVPQFGEMMA